MDLKNGLRAHNLVAMDTLAGYKGERSRKDHILRGFLPLIFVLLLQVN
jgi:hypothetical protein